VFPLPLAQVVSRTFAGERPHDGYMLGLLDDLAGRYDLEYDREALASARRTTFTTMVDGMLPDLIGDGSPVGLAVLAHSTPDGEPNWPACYLNRHLPGHPFAFAVADQGPVAPFTALRAAAAYVRAGDLKRAMVIALDQDTMLCAPGLAEPPAVNRAVALVFDERGSLGDLSVEVSPAASAGPTAPAASAGPTAPAASAAPATAAWAALSERVAAGDAEIRIDGHDAVSGAHGSAVLRLGVTGAV
jgi:hypothetical protein